MSPVTIVLLVILAVLIAATIALYFLGKKAQKRKDEQDAQLAATAQHRCPTVQCVTDFFTPLYRPTSLCRNGPYSIPQTLHRHTPADIYPVLPHCRNSLVDREESHHQFLN